MTCVKYILPVILLLAVGWQADAQERFFPRNQKPQRTEVREHCKEVFQAIREALVSGNIDILSSRFAEQVQIDLRGAERGYYSSYQAASMLTSYFRTRRLLGLSFTTTNESDSNPYATGGGSFSERGSREYVQVFVSLTKSGDHWAISRLNIY
jgi:hypothetical protein